jgi:nucleoside-diphosphate-sugar epimerase
VYASETKEKIMSMRIFVAGVSGALGKQLVPRLVAAGHDVTGASHSESKRSLVESLGARAVAVDLLDAEAVEAAVRDAAPDVVVHEATALSGDLDMRKPDQTFAQTNRLRTEGTRNLMAAAQAAGARRFVAQSFAGWPYARQGGFVKSEEDPLEQHPPKGMARTLAAIRELERIVTTAEGIEPVVLRYGGFYGPGTSIAPDGEQLEAILSRKFPVVRSADGLMSLVHIDDAAAATALAIESGRPGVYNVVDDEPAPAHEWIPTLAEEIGAKPPLRIPRWLARVFAGEAMTTMLTEGRGASNAKAKRMLGWEPRYASWRRGFAEGLS